MDEQLRNYLCEILLTLRSRVWPCGLGTCGLANCGLDSAGCCCGLLEFLVLLIEYSDDENPEFELVEVIVFVDKSITGAFELVMLLLFAEPVTTDAVDVEVGEGELDDVLYGKGAMSKGIVAQVKLMINDYAMMNRLPVGSYD